MPNELETSRTSPSLLFDAEGVTLIGRYSDELAAYRARKSWIEILNAYFLLEDERDYEMTILSSAEIGYHVLSCYFTSACGRYAFWRLINDQAPEAELQLCETGICRGKPRKGLFTSFFSGESTRPQEPWVFTGEDEEAEDPDTLISSMRSYFRGLWT